MNIFLTSKNPEVAASHLDNLRLNKMILETAQLLSQAYRHLYGEDVNLYKNTHINHPCAIWARESESNYKWLVSYFFRLNKEKEERDKHTFNKIVKTHASFKKLFHIFESKLTIGEILQKDFPNINFSFNCTDFKDLPVELAYQKQLIKKWNNDFERTKKHPEWVISFPLLFAWFHKTQNKYIHTLDLKNETPNIQ